MQKNAGTIQINPIVSTPICRVPRKYIPTLLLLLLSTGSNSEPNTAIPSDTALEKSGAIIGAVIFQINDVFDTANPKENKSVFRLANRLHIDTRRHVIESQLLFRTGDPFSRQKTEESARLLRQNGFLYSADIRATSYRNGVVELTVTTRDNWTLLPKLSLSRGGGETRHYFGLDEKNLVGTGSEITVAKRESDDRSSIEYEFYDRNIGRSWASLNLAYSDSDDGRAHRFHLSRPFFALTTRWSAGIDLSKNDRIESLYSRGKIAARYRHDEQRATMWLGSSKGLVDNWAKRWIAGFALAESRFSAVSEPDLRLIEPDNRSLQYPFLRYDAIQNHYVVARNLNYIDRTEDIYLGTQYSATIGFLSKKLGSDSQGLTFDASFKRSIGDPNNKLLILYAGLNGRTESDNFYNTVIQLQSEYFHRISDRRIFYGSLRTTVGRDLDSDNPITLGGKFGLRGYPRAYGNGDSSALLTIEQRYMTNYYPFRLFRIGGAIYLDIGRTWGNDIEGISDSHLLGSIGFGLRLASTRGDSNRIVHIDLAFPLRGDSSIDNVQLIIEAKRGY